jgi:uncharacterized protein (DUF1501 family)
MHITRRSFFKQSVGSATLLAFGSTVPGFLARAALTDSSRSRGRNTVLVLLQLSGGNDGLNTVVPFEDDAYHRARPTLRLSGDKVHKIDAQLGFHPDAPAFQRLYKEGHLSIAQGVGYPNNNRNHEIAMRDWQTGRPGEATAQTGWVGRVVDSVCEAGGTEAAGVFVGPIVKPFSVHAEKAVVPAVASLQQWSPGGAGARGRFAEAMKGEQGGSGDPLLQFVRRTAMDAVATRDRIAAVAEAWRSAAKYPPLQFAKTLQTVAQLIRADVGVRIFCAELGGGGIGGFDNHAGQVYNHGPLLRQLSEAVAAFVDDLRRDKLLDQVLLMTFSEFGRTLAENGRRGTDHGAAQPIFLAGGKLKPGLIGAHPSLKPSALDGGAPRVHTDFRRLYATALDRWLGFDSRAILGQSFQPLDVLVG